MEEVVAIKIVDGKGKRHGVLTWGRVFDASDPRHLLSVVRAQLGQFGLKQIRSIKVCDTLQAVAEQPYFYEALIAFSQHPIPYGKAYSKWRATRRKQIVAGKEIYYLGKRRTKSG